MESSVLTQLRLVQERVREANESLSSDTATLDGIRKDRADTATEVEALQRRLDVMRAKAERLAAEERVVERRVEDGVEAYTRAKVIEARLRRHLRSLRGCQQAAVCLAPHGAGSSSGGPATGQLDTDSATAPLSMVGVDGVEERRSGRRLAMDYVTCAAPGESSRILTDEAMETVVKDTLDGYNYTLLLHCVGTKSDGLSMESDTDVGVHRGSSPPPESPHVDRCDGQCPSGSHQNWCSSWECMSEMVGQAAELIFESLVEAPNTHGVVRYRLSLSACAALVNERSCFDDKAGGTLVDLLDTVKSEASHRVQVSELPTLGNTNGVVHSGETPVFTAAAIPVDSARGAVAICRHALRQLRGLDMQERGIDRADLAIVQIHVETFDVGGSFRRSALRVVGLGDGGHSPCVAYVKDAIALAADLGRKAAAAATHPSNLSSEMSTASRLPSPHTSVLQTQLQRLPSRLNLSTSAAPVLDPVFGGNSKALLVLRLSWDERSCRDAFSGASSDRHGAPVQTSGAGAAPKQVTVASTLWEAVTYAHAFHAFVRHAASPYVVPSELIATGREAEAVLFDVALPRRGGVAYSSA